MEAQTRRSFGASAPYGQACMACSRAKCKCVLIDGSTCCERCARLNKVCEPIHRVRRRKTQKPNISKTARLEEKLDGIALLLKSATQSAQVTAQLDQILLERGIETEPPTAVHVDQHLEHGQTSNQSNGSTDAGSYYSTPSASNAPTDFSVSDIEDHLAVFRSFKSKHFPFIHIPHDMTAHTFRQERPFTWLCVLATTIKPMSQQTAIGNKIRNEISQRMIFNAEKSLDLLFGILVYIGWFTSQVCARPQTALFTQLAVSLVYDLALNRTPTNQPHIMKTFGLQANNCVIPSTDRVRTNDERRAVLGCFLLSSTVASYYQKIDTLRWTAHMEECLRVLADGPEAFTDELLVQQVKLQLVYDSALHAPRFDYDINNGAPQVTEFYYKALQVQLDEVKNNIPQSCHNDATILGSIYNTELAINELAITDKPLTSFGNINSSRIDRLYACLVSIKAWFDLYLSLPLICYVDSSFCTYAQLTHCLICLYKLSTFEDPAWDQKMVRDTIDVLLVLDQMATAMEQVPEIIGLEEDDDVENLFTKGARLFRAARRNWEPKFNNISGDSAEEAAFTASPLSFTDYMWLPDFLTT